MSCSLFGVVGELPLLNFQENLNQFVSYSPYVTECAPDW